ncbi:MAG: glycosyltransferase family 4 protein [Pararhizobium sp.]
MKIVQVQTQAEAAGAQRISDMVGAGLRARGHDVRTVFMYRKTDVYDADPYADFVLRDPPAGLGGQIRACIGLATYLRAQRPEAVISYQHYGNIFGTIGARFASVRHVLANQSGAPQSRGVMGLLSRIDKLMGVVGLYQLNVVNSAWNEAQFADYPQAYRRRLRRIDHGVAGPERGTDKAAARAAFGLPQEVMLAVTTGRQVRQKNHIALIEALPELPHLHLALAGVGPEGERLAAAAVAASVADRVHFVGEVAPARIFEFLAAGDLYVFPSQNETFGLSVVEAAIAGLPVVSNGLPVLREVLSTEDGEPAAVFSDADDAAAIARAVAAVIETPGLGEQLAAAGRRLADKYSTATMCRAYEALLTGR